MVALLARQVVTWRILTLIVLGQVVYKIAGAQRQAYTAVEVVELRAVGDQLPPAVLEVGQVWLQGEFERRSPPDYGLVVDELVLVGQSQYARVALHDLYDLLPRLSISAIMLSVVIGQHLIRRN